MEVAFFIILFVLGACLGSFLCCQVRRLHLKSTTKSKAHLGSRSVCLKCHYQLKWYDNLPIISWLALRGRCRQCHAKIGLAEIISELSLGLTFLALGTTISLASATVFDWAIFVVTALLVLTLAFLAIYDGLYGELPTTCLYVAIAFAVVVLTLKTWQSLTLAPFSAALIYQPLLSVAILGGLYLLLYKISHGQWVGDGDWLLGTAIGLALANAWLALLTLCAANLLACLVMAPAFFKHKRHKIYFGPFLAIAFILALVSADWLLSLV